MLALGTILTFRPAGSPTPERQDTMSYVLIATTAGQTLEHFWTISDKLGDPKTVDGLLVQAAGADESNLRVVSVWESRAHMERYQAERLFPAFQAAGLTAADIVGGTTFVDYDTEDLFVR